MAGSVGFDPRISTGIVTKIRTELLNRPHLIVGIAGPQGSGKSTISNLISNDLLAVNIPTAVVSLDDFYLKHSERSELAAKIHPLLKTRGVPGTHNVDLLRNTLRRLLDSRVTEVSWPVFCKKLDDKDPDKVRSFHRSANMDKMVIILEGWCVGCKSLTNIDEAINDLERTEDPDCSWRRYIDNEIRTKYEGVWNLVHFFIYLQVPDWSYVKKWRSEQSLTTDEDLVALNIDRFIQFFERISRQMMNRSERRLADIEVKLDTEHRIKDLKFNSR